MRVSSRLVHSERKTKYRTDGEWEYSAGSGAHNVLTAGGVCDKMINIGIDAHRITCVATIKDGRGKRLEQMDFANNKDGINGFMGYVREEYGRRGPSGPSASRPRTTGFGCTTRLSGTESTPPWRTLPKCINTYPSMGV